MKEKATNILIREDGDGEGDGLEIITINIIKRLYKFVVSYAPNMQF